MEWAVFRYNVPFMAHVIQLALSAFMTRLDVKGGTKSWEAYERNQQFAENESGDIGVVMNLSRWLIHFV